MIQGEKKKLGFMLTTGMESEDAHTVVKLAEAALEEGLEVSIFLMCDGIYHLISEPLNALVDKGAELSLCAHNAEQRKAEKKGTILFGSQYDLANIVAESDRFLAFN